MGLQKRSLMGGAIRATIIVADDHEPLLEKVKALLSPHFNIVGIVADGAELVLAAGRLLPDVIVTDIGMPKLTGIDAAHKLRASGSTAKIVFLTLHAEKEFLEACLEAGAMAYVRKLSMNHHLVPAIQAVLAGQFYVSKSGIPQ